MRSILELLPVFLLGALLMGSDLSGQSTPPESRFVQVSAGDQHTCGRDADGGVVCWGNDAQGQCEVPVSFSGG